MRKVKSFLGLGMFTAFYNFAGAAILFFLKRGSSIAAQFLGLRLKFN